MRILKKALGFIVLIPHRDALRPLVEMKTELFQRGIYGAHSLPVMAPLARVSKALSRDELQELGRNLRNLTMERKGVIRCGAKALAAFSGELFFFGPALDIQIDEAIPERLRGKLIHTLTPAVLCTALVRSGENIDSLESPALSFRAAALANLSIRPLAGDEPSFEWKKGPPVWLTKQ